MKDTLSNKASSTACVLVIGPPSQSSGGNPPPGTLKVGCPSSKATIGQPYSSQVPVSGGSGSYTFSISTGSLPDGLTLNAKTGVISGTPQKDAETGSFKIEVVDNKTGAIGYSSCSGSCSVGTTVTYGGVPGWGSGQCGSSKTYTSNGKPITFYGYNTNGQQCNLSSNSNWDGTTSLGISSWGNQNQIDSGHFVQCELSTSHANGATISVGTTDWYATYDIYGSNEQGQLGTCLKSNVNADCSFQAIPKCTSYKYISIKAHQGNCQVKSVQVNYPCTCSIDVGQVCDQGGQGGQQGWGGQQGGGQKCVGYGNSSGGQNTGQCAF